MQDSTQWYWIGFGVLLVGGFVVAAFFFVRAMCLCRGNEILRNRRIKDVTISLTVRSKEDLESQISTVLTTPSFKPEFMSTPNIQTSTTHTDFFATRETADYFNFSSKVHHGRISRTHSLSRLDDSHLRSVSRMLWQKLTVSTKEETITKTTYRRSKSTLTRRDHRVYTSNPGKFFPNHVHRRANVNRLAWNNNSMKVQLFAKLVSGYFTVDSMGRLCKVNDWKHVSDKDLRYREKAIFALACNNEIEVSDDS